MRYASVNAHNHYKLSRRDDLESLGYMLIHMCREGGLPWNPADGEAAVRIQKETTDEIELCDGLPIELAHFLQYVKSLDFQAKPNYDYLRQKLIAAARNLNIDLKDKLYDWTIKTVIMKNYPLFYGKILTKQYNFNINDFTNPTIFDKKGDLIVKIPDD